MPGARDDEGGTGGYLKIRLFVPPGIVFPHLVTVVAKKDDDGVPGGAHFLQGLQQAAHAGIDVADAGQVGLRVAFEE
jgi:hypothetical protein